MSTVFLVSSGDYSDYAVDGVFSSRANAEEFVKRVSATGWSSWNDVREVELDGQLPALREGMVPWHVLMLRDGTTEEVKAVEANRYNLGNVSARGYIWPRSTAPAYRGRGIPDVLQMTVMAKDAAGAAKIADERRAQLIASGEWS